MNLEDIITWTVSTDHKAIPKNMYRKPTVTEMSNDLKQSRDYFDFQTLVNKITLDCDEALLPGDYPAEDVKLIWQYFNPSFDGVWIDLSYEPSQKYDGTAYRQYLQLKQPGKPEIITIGRGIIDYSHESKNVEILDKVAGNYYYDNHIGTISGSDAETFRLGAKFGVQWQKGQAASPIEVIKKRTEELKVMISQIDDYELASNIDYATKQLNHILKLIQS